MSNTPASNLPNGRFRLDRSGCTPDESEPEEPEPSSPRSIEHVDAISGKISGDVVVNQVWDDTIVDQLSRLDLAAAEIERAVRAAAADQGFHRGEIGVRVTDDVTIHQINRQYLDHDYATDVISFAYGDQPGEIEGELVVSVETAEANAAEANAAKAGWSARDELLLYVIHGTLHIAGMDDHEPEDRLAMRAAEGRVLAALGMTPDPVHGGRDDG